MGLNMSKLLPASIGYVPIYIMVFGLEGAGKRTLASKLQLSSSTAYTTEGVLVMSMGYNNVRFEVFDVVAGKNVNPPLPAHFKGPLALVFVVDAHNREKISEAAEELHRVLIKPEFHNVPLLVFCNKLDVSQAMTKAEIETKLGLHALISGTWYTQGSSGSKGEGIYDGFQWLSNNIK
ncbi:ARF/SAR protein [Mollisia scopiformis]|uniref:ADP-ribosylation factor n=1 Tax=Mollisia scopiformis TaxID=149040 RepID=A0A194XUW6_MOLSC|nr:ARF/SAR protein [Mollisia scopiformis]KUJ23829.1 ARF/SAR protein [Mollisia scopiformis]